MAKLELELNDELSERLQRVATKVALTPAETAKMILAHQLAGESGIDWIAPVIMGKELHVKVLPARHNIN